MLRKDYIILEGKLALNMLKEASHNKEIKLALQQASLLLIKSIFVPLKKELTKVNNFSDLPQAQQEILINLAAEHTQKKRQYGAAMPSIATSQEILASVSNIYKLIQIQEDYLLNLDRLTTVDEMAIVM